MTWLNMSDAAQRGIRVTLLSSLAKETVVAIPTRYGDVTMTRDDAVCCGHIRYGDHWVEIASTGQIYASLEGVYKVKEGDLLVISSTSGPRGSPPRHYALLVDQGGMTDLTTPDFGTSDGTFKATQRDDEVLFDLGFQGEEENCGLQKWDRHSRFSVSAALMVNSALNLAAPNRCLMRLRCHAAALRRGPGLPVRARQSRGRKRCRLHGGLSPGAPRDSRNGNYTNGEWTAEAIDAWPPRGVAA